MHGDPVGQVADDAEVVGDEQVARPALGLQLGQQVEDRGLDRDVERARRLVGDDDPRVAGERPGDRHALLEAARQLARLEVEVALGQAQVGGQLVDPLVDGLALQPGQLADRARQDVARGPAAVERRVGVLEDHLDGALVLGRPAASTWPPSGVLVELDRCRRRRGPRCRGSSWPASTCPSPTRRPARASRRRAARGRRRPAPARRGRSGGTSSRRRSTASATLAADGVRADDRRRLGDLAEPVDVVAARPAGRRRRRRPAARPCGTARRRAGSGRRRRRSAGSCRSAAGCPGSSTAPARTCGRRGAGSERSRPTVYGCCGFVEDLAASPSSTILPAYITPTRSHIVRMTPRLWAISRTAALVSAWSVRTRSSTLASTVASSPVVGSSRTSSFGSEASAMAMTTRCCIPPESWCG